MASTGNTFPTAHNEINDSSNPWTNPTNAYADDAAEASNGVDKNDNSNWLELSGFGFSIPGGSTINGITMYIIDARASTSFRFDDEDIRLMTATTVYVGDNKADPTDWPTSATTRTYGGSSDDWNASLTATQINDSNFGCVIHIDNLGGAATIYLDAVALDIDYTPATYRTQGFIYG